MAAPIKIKIGHLCLKAELHDTDTAKGILSILPYRGSFNVWGDEFYFEVPYKATLDHTATTKVRIGDIGYWPPGSAIAIFFGPTPLSTGTEPVPASEVNIIGRILDDPRELIEVKSEEEIVIEVG